MAFIISTFLAIGDCKTTATVSCNVPIYLPAVTTTTLYCLVTGAMESKQLVLGVHVYAAM